MRRQAESDPSTRHLVAAGGPFRLLLVCLVLCLGSGPGCGATSSDGDADGDADSVGDGDADADGQDDAEADVETEADVDVDEGGGTGLCADLSPGEIAWSWPPEDLGEIAFSNVAGGRLSVVSVNDAHQSVIHVLDAATGERVEEHVLAGPDAPERPLIDVNPLATVFTAVFLARDELGRTYVLHVPNAGDETSIPTMVYRYDADGTKAYGTALPNSVHASLLIDHDGEGGAVVEVGRHEDTRRGRVLAHVGGDGTLLWEYRIPGSTEPGGVAIAGEHVWVTGRRLNSEGVWLPWVGLLYLDTGEPTGVEAYLPDAPRELAPRGIAVAPEGDIYVAGHRLSGLSAGIGTVLRASSRGSERWQHDLPGEPVFGWWVLDMDSDDRGRGVCVSAPAAADELSRRETIACFGHDSELLLEISERATGAGEGGVDVDPDGNVYSLFFDEHYRVNCYCSPFEG